MGPALKRMTTQYIATEDRVRLAGLGALDQSLVLWITRRLSDRLIHYLCKILVDHSSDSQLNSVHQELVQEFAQERAYSDIEPSNPVQISPKEVGHLIVDVDVTISGNGIVMNFKAADQVEVASISLTFKELRQWLGIMSMAYKVGDWPLDSWPNWALQLQQADSIHTEKLVH
jgi:hypothetical protein